MSWQKLKFGRHKGSTLPEVLFRNPGWFFYIISRKKYKDYKSRVEFDRILERACSVFTPEPFDPDSEVEYYFDHIENKFHDFRIVPSSKPLGRKPFKCIRKSVVDFSVIFKNDPYDKRGYRFFLKTFKRYYFGNEKFSMTKEACDKFFDNELNFVSEKYPKRSLLPSEKEKILEQFRLFPKEKILQQCRLYPKVRS